MYLYMYDSAYLSEQVVYEKIVPGVGITLIAGNT